MSKGVTPEESTVTLERVGRYELIAPLTRGALGPLWVARVASGAEEGRIVTIRRVTVDGSRSELVSELTEATLAAMEVRHSRIVAVLDVTLSGSELCVVSEYVDGEVLYSLQQLAFARRAPFAPAAALRIGLDMLSALGTARALFLTTGAKRGSLVPHLNGGLSPDSIMVAAYGEVLLGDLGIAAAAVRFPEFRLHPEVLPYRAPETLTSDAEPDERADVFSVGVLMWELLTNRALFGSVSRLRNLENPFSRELSPALREESEALQRKLQTQVIPRLDAVGRQGARIGSDVANLVARALERDPARRYQTLREMEDAILALPRDTVSTPEQLSVALHKLAHAASHARRQIIDRFLHLAIRESAPPESDRPTRRPALAAGVVPAEIIGPEATAPAGFAPGFGEHEAPTHPGTAPRRPTLIPRRTLQSGTPDVVLKASPVIAEAPVAPVETLQGMAPTAVLNPIVPHAPDAAIGPFEVPQTLQGLAPSIEINRSSAPPASDNPPVLEVASESSEPAAALRPAAIVDIGSLPAPRAAPVVEAFPPVPAAGNNEHALRAAFEAARQAELSPNAPELAARSQVPPAVVSGIPPVHPAGPPEHGGERRQRARSLAIGIAAVVSVVALIALVRALFTRHAEPSTNTHSQSAQATARPAPEPEPAKPALEPSSQPAPPTEAPSVPQPAASAPPSDQASKPASPRLAPASGQAPIKNPNGQPVFRPRGI